MAHAREGVDRRIMSKNILNKLCVKDVTGLIQLSVKPNGWFLCDVEFIFTASEGFCCMQLMEWLWEICGLLRCCAASISSYVPMFRADLQVTTSGVKQSMKTLEEGIDSWSRNIVNQLLIYAA